MGLSNREVDDHYQELKKYYKQWTEGLIKKQSTRPYEIRNGLGKGGKSVEM